MPVDIFLCDSSRLAREVAQAEHACQCQAASIDIGLRSVLSARGRGRSLANSSSRDGSGRVVGGSYGGSTFRGGAAADTAKVDGRFEGTGGCERSSSSYRTDIMSERVSKDYQHERERGTNME